MESGWIYAPSRKLCSEAACKIGQIGIILPVKGLQRLWKWMDMD